MTPRRWIKLKSACGYEFQVWRKCREFMPLIDQRYLDCSIYLYRSVQSAQDGENFGGSGCLIRVLSPPVHSRWGDYVSGKERYSYFPGHIYAVTNNHVARKGYPVIRLNTIDGKTDVLDLDHSDWIPHPSGDDLAVAPINLPESKHHYFPIDVEQFVKEINLYESAYDMRIGAGEDTFMVGRFISHAGKQKNTPSLRFGSIAMLPFEKVKLNAEANYHMQQAFLVETRSISGASGSPVFLYRPMIESYETADGPHEGMVDPVGEPYLLGIDCGHIPKHEKVVRVENGRTIEHPQGWRIDTNTGMAVVIPAWRLMDLLNKPELVMKREEKDKKYKAEHEQEETVSLDIEKPETFTKESYQDALRRASRKVSETKDSDKAE